MSLVSIVQTELVDRRGFIAQSDMLNGISMAAILPGPLAVNVVAYTGFIMRGLPGAMVCMTAVILPSFFLMVMVALAFLQWGELPITTALLATFMPAVVVVIAHAGINMGRKVITDVLALIPATIAFVAVVFAKGFYVTPAIIILGGLWGFFMSAPAKEEMVFERDRQSSIGEQLMVAFFLAIILFIFIFVPDIFQSYSLAHLFSTFGGMSLTLFGGGYVFIPMIQKIVVETYQWIGFQEFNLAISAGQLTPGPILISAAYIGYSFAGMAGAVTATLGMFVPPALLITVASTWLNRIKDLAAMKRALQGIRTVVIGMILAAAVVLALRVNPDWKSALIFILSIAALFRFNANPTIVIPMAGAIGVTTYFLDI